jgi:YfiH family protein
MADFIRSALLASHGVTGLFSLRAGGVSPPPFNSLNFGRGLGDPDDNVEQNLDRLVHAGGLPCRPHQTEQIHETGMKWCSGNGIMHADKADILFAEQTDTPLAVRTADCLAMLLADPDSGIIAAVHAGWRGSAAGIATIAVRNMQKRGARAKNILASLGPSIGPCCFAIDETTARALTSGNRGAQSHVSFSPVISADLRGINRLQLLQCGLDKAHIEETRICTACDVQRCFSYRRDGGKAGRHLAVVALPSTT